MSSTLSAHAAPLTSDQSVRQFLAKRRPDLTVPEGMEIHISTFGEPPEDGLEWWGEYRIDAKKGSRAAPFVLDDHAAKIGSTGWNYLEQSSKWVGFDFDAITGHADGVGVDDAELERVKQAAQHIPYVEVRRSTSGNGLHLYVYFADGIPTENRKAHAALARAVLRLMSEAAGFDFTKAIDACGSNMWIWNRAATERSFALLKAAESKLSEADLPANWIEQHVDKHGAIRVNLDGVERTQVALDAKHKATIERLRKSGYPVVWVPEHNLLQTHTRALQDIEHAGDFYTLARGRDKSKPNCFLFALADGRWQAVLFSPGRKEHESWTHGQWTYTTYNAPLSYTDAIGRFPLLRTAKGHQASFEQAAEIARLTGCRFTVPEVAAREITMTVLKDGILLRMPIADGETLTGWGRHKTTRDDSWELVIDRGQPIKAVKVAVASAKAGATEQNYHLDQLRHTFLNGKNWGWYRRIRGEWRTIGRADARATVMDLHFGGQDHPEVLISRYQERSLDIVTVNFGSEYPSDHEWNLYGARFRYAVADQDGPTDHFDMVLAHLGGYLDPYVSADEWCQSRGITTGAQYLLLWVAIMLQQPDRHLPWLFFVGPQDHGKSAFADMLFVLFLVGARNVDKAFTRGNNFDEEFAGTIFAVISETSLTFPIQLARKNYNRIKQVTVADEIEVEKKGCDAQRFPNQTHFVQESNYHTDCPIVDADDTRLTVIEAPPLDDMLGDADMLAGWQSEASNFIRRVVTLDLSPFKGGCGKLALPCLFTAGKQRVISEVAKILSHDSADQKFVALACDVRGQLVALATAGKLQGVTASDVLAMLKLTDKHEWARCPNVIGTMLKHVDPIALHVCHRRRRYWITPPPVSHLRD